MQELLKPAQQQKYLQTFSSFFIYYKNSKRIARRAEKKGESILFSTKTEQDQRMGIETYMDFKIECLVWPDDVDVSNELMPEEKNSKEHYNPTKKEMMIFQVQHFTKRKKKIKK